MISRVSEGKAAPVRGFLTVIKKAAEVYESSLSLGGADIRFIYNHSV
jgi:hypothetical protein